MTLHIHRVFTVWVLAWLPPPAYLSTEAWRYVAIWIPISQRKPYGSMNLALEPPQQSTGSQQPCNWATWASSGGDEKIEWMPHFSKSVADLTNIFCCWYAAKSIPPDSTVVERLWLVVSFGSLRFLGPGQEESRTRQIPIKRIGDFVFGFSCCCLVNCNPHS